MFGLQIFYSQFFFFVIGCELKHEFVLGTLSNPRIAVVPIGAAFGGMVTAAAIFLAFNLVHQRKLLGAYLFQQMSPLH